MKSMATYLRCQCLIITLIVSSFFPLFSFIFNTRPKIQAMEAFTQTSSRAKVHNQVECQWFCVAGLFFCVCVGCGEKQNVILSLCIAAHILILNPYWM